MESQYQSNILKNQVIYSPDLKQIEIEESWRKYHNQISEFKINTQYLAWSKQNSFEELEQKYSQIAKKQIEIIDKHIEKKNLISILNKN